MLDVAAFKHGKLTIKHEKVQLNAHRPGSQGSWLLAGLDSSSAERSSLKLHELPVQKMLVHSQADQQQNFCCLHVLLLSLFMQGCAYRPCPQSCRGLDTMTSEPAESAMKCRAVQQLGSFLLPTMVSLSFVIWTPAQMISPPAGKLDSGRAVVVQDQKAFPYLSELPMGICPRLQMAVKSSQHLWHLDFPDQSIAVPCSLGEVFIHCSPQDFIALHDIHVCR